MEGNLHGGRRRRTREPKTTAHTNLQTNLSTYQPGQTPHGEGTTNVARLQAPRTGTYNIPSTEPTPGAPPHSPDRRTKRAPRKPRRRKDPSKPKNQRARKHLVLYIDSFSSSVDSSEENEQLDQGGPPQPGPAPHPEPTSPTRYIAGGDELSSSEEDLFFPPQRADGADSSPDFHGFAAPAEFQRESTAAEKAAFDQVTGRVTRHRAAKEDINVPTHQRCAPPGQSSKKK